MTGRLQTWLFVALCVAGLVASVALTVHEVARTTPIALTVTATHRTGETTLVTVSVHNRTATTRCLVVRVAARDRVGHDLAAGIAAPALSVPAHAQRTIQTRLTLTPRQYAEQLDAFYPSQRACPGS